MKTKIALMLLCAALLVGSASAASQIIDFSTGAAVDNGTVSYAGGVAPLIGLNIGIGLVRGVNTPSNNGVTDTITAGLLNFTSGSVETYSAVLDEYYFSGPGGTITITGTGPGCGPLGPTGIGACGGNTPNTTSGPNLLTGTIASASYTANGTLVIDLATVSGTDSKDPLLVQYFGFDPAVVSFKFSGTINTNTPVLAGGAGSAFTAASAGSTDIKNTAVPEPASVLFLGTFLLGITGLVRRRVSKA